jgi:hypothetical protein
VSLFLVHNTDGSWTFIDQFKKAQGIDRANIRFGNVNGKGGQDLIWIDKFSGDATVFINNGRLDTGGSRYWFLDSGKQYAGSWAGTCQYFPDLDGDGRADLHSNMDSITNKAETFFNRCGLIDLSGDDAGWTPGQDPGFGALPTYTPPPIPGIPDKGAGGWRDVKCDSTTALNTTTADGRVRWKDAMANDAWDYALSGKFLSSRCACSDVWTISELLFVMSNH